MTKKELELRLWQTVSNPQQLPDIYEGIEELLENNNIEPEFRCPGAPWDPIFKEIVKQVRPETIIEVGSYIGYSAVKMADYCKEEGLTDTSIICVDPWLDVSNPIDFNNRINGYPALYYKFLYNVKHHGHSDMVIPFPMPALTAYRYLAAANVKADLIYIDGSHEYDDVYLDVSRYITLLNQGGIIFGDDWTWEGVEKGVLDVCRDSNIQNLQLIPNTSVWYIQK